MYILATRMVGQEGLAISCTLAAALHICGAQPVFLSLFFPAMLAPPYSACPPKTCVHHLFFDFFCAGSVACANPVFTCKLLQFFFRPTLMLS